MALRKLMELGNLQDKTKHAATPSKEGVGGLCLVLLLLVLRYNYFDVLSVL